MSSIRSPPQKICMQHFQVLRFSVSLICHMHYAQLKISVDWVTINIHKGLYSYTKLYLMGLNLHLRYFSFCKGLKRLCACRIIFLLVVVMHRKTFLS